MTRTQLADSMWGNFKKLPIGARDRISIIRFRNYVDAVADDLGLEKEELDWDKVMESLKAQPYDALYAHHNTGESQ